MARICCTVAVPLAIVAFIAIMALVVQIAPDTSPTAVALAGRDVWAPRWLVSLSVVATGVGVISIVGIYLPALRGLGFLIVPVGLGWMIASGTVLLRQGRRPRSLPSLVEAQS